jgi:hypothetical protein
MHPGSFPLEIVFRIYDNCLASGIEAIFGFSIVLLQKNEKTLLELKFDEILVFLNTRLLERYKVRPVLTDLFNLPTVYLSPIDRINGWEGNLQGGRVSPGCTCIEHHTFHAGWIRT